VIGGSIGPISWKAAGKSSARRAGLIRSVSKTLIGEAAGRIPEAERAKALGIGWKRIIGARNIVVHAYHGLDGDIIWDIVSKRIPQLQSAMEAVKFD